MISKYCSRCKAVMPLDHKHRAPDRRPSAAARGYDTQHRKDRERYLARHPTCEEPGCLSPSTVLDHIDGLGPKGPAGHDEGNWMALCASCHGRKTTAQSPGGFNA
jgi:5-methylcytosine-specific restriction protein A